MDVDIPVAHSMDTTFFAVDAAGHVGRFDTGVEGHVPEGARGSDVSLESWELDPEDAWGTRESDLLTSERGVFWYEYDEESWIHIAPYRLIDTPQTPLHIDQLPPELRQMCKRIRFEGTDFSASELVQPLEQLRPIPGKEDQFADFCRQFREEEPEQAGNMIFEGLEDEPEKDNGDR